MLRHSQGTYTKGPGGTAGQDKYVGDFVAGKKHGKGEYSYTDKSVYVGDFGFGMRSGAGVLKHANGDAYDGQWKNGVQQGEGTFTWANGDAYDGEWAGGNPVGKGSMTRSRQKGTDQTACFAEGDWEGGVITEGKVMFPNGDVYTGELAKKGMRHGEGTYMWEDTGEYDGCFIGGSMEGKADYTSHNGNTLQALFVHGQVDETKPMKKKQLEKNKKKEKDEEPVPVENA